MENKIGIAYLQLSEILKYVPTKYFAKIPDEILERIELQKSTKNIFKYDPSKTFAEQNILDTTRTMISILYRDYWTNEDEKIKIKTNEQKERIKNENIAREKYNTDNLFKKEKILKNKNMDINNNLPVKKKEKIIFKKIQNSIRKIIRILYNKK